MKFRKKPIVVDAWQFDGSIQSANFIFEQSARHFYFCRNGELLINTLEGEMGASAGDWVIKGMAGEFYPCKPDIFKATYDPVPDAHDGRQQPRGTDLADAEDRSIGMTAKEIGEA